MMRSDLIEMEAGRPSTMPSEADDVHGYVAPIIYGAIICIDSGILLGMGSYLLWFRGDSLAGAIQQAVEGVERLGY